jgi:toxin-antitoxin system PIN domain toxin
MTSLLFPDVKVWVALNYGRHLHHGAAQLWYEALSVQARIAFCRQTQMGLFRILSTAAVLREDVLSQRSCWQVFDQWISTGQVDFADEPAGMEVRLRTLTVEDSASPKAWMDAYLAAFAEAGGMQLVTFDRALAGKAKDSLLLA